MQDTNQEGPEINAASPADPSSQESSAQNLVPEPNQDTVQPGSIKRQEISLTQGRAGILGIKAGMTQIYNEQGESFAVTVIDLRPTILTQIKTLAKNGYQAVQVGFLEKKKKACNLPESGHARASQSEGFYHYQEFRLPVSSSLAAYSVGQLLTADFLKPGDYVDLSSRSKGKGFQGGVKRYHMAGGNKTHGASLSHRQLGSIGNRADPGKCFKNKKMAGQMGNERVTVQNVKVLGVDLENQILLVHGSVPGPKSGIVSIRRAVKSLAEGER